MHINLSFRPKIKTLGLIQGPALISAGLQAACTESCVWMKTAAEPSEQLAELQVDMLKNS